MCTNVDFKGFEIKTQTQGNNITFYYCKFRNVLIIYRILQFMASD